MHTSSPAGDIALRRILDAPDTATRRLEIHVQLADHRVARAIEDDLPLVQRRQVVLAPLPPRQPLADLPPLIEGGQERSAAALVSTLAPLLIGIVLAAILLICLAIAG